MTVLSEERQLIKATAAQFTDDVVLPTANTLDPIKGKIPEKLIQEMAELGFFGIKTPVEYGGSGLGCFEYCLVAEELSRGWMSVGSIMARSMFDVFKHMPLEKQQHYVPRAARGDFLVAMALSEPNVGSDLSAIACRATRVDEGTDWVLNGNKYWCTFADDADALVVFARTPSAGDSGRSYKGISAFLVEKPRGELPQGCVGSAIPKIGYYGWNTFELSFDNCRIPKESLIGEEGKGFLIMANTLETARVHTAARAIGLAQGALDCAVQYSQDREQFGQPIARFQDLRFKIARMASQIEASRQLMYSVCDKIDQGGRCDKEAAMAKWMATEMSERVCSDALQILGGAGYTTDFPVERYWRDARLTKIFEGTSEIQLRIISDHILGK